MKKAKKRTGVFVKQEFNCSLCMAKFCREPPYTVHLETCHFNTVDNIKVLSCNNCGFKTGNNAAFQKHVKGVSCYPNKQFFKCEYCDQLLVVDFNRKKHVRLFHADKLEGKVSVYHCLTCGYKVANEYYFYEHKFKCVKPKKPPVPAAAMVDKPPEPQSEPPKEGHVKLIFGLPVTVSQKTAAEKSESDSRSVLGS